MLSHLKILYLLSLKNLLWACEILFETQFGKKSTWQHWVAKLVKLNKRYPTLYIANCTNPMYENSQHVTSACHQTSKLFQHSLNPYSVYLSDKKMIEKDIFRSINLCNKYSWTWKLCYILNSQFIEQSVSVNVYK